MQSNKVVNKLSAENTDEINRTKEILERITRLRLERGWSEYSLAQYAEIPQSTISNWYRKTQAPTIRSLEKICKGLGVSLSHFFAEGEDMLCLTSKQRELLDNWSALSPKQQDIFLNLLKNIPLQKR